MNPIQILLALLRRNRAVSTPNPGQQNQVEDLGTLPPMNVTIPPVPTPPQVVGVPDVGGAPERAGVQFAREDVRQALAERRAQEGVDLLEQIDEMRNSINKRQNSRALEAVEDVRQMTARDVERERDRVAYRRAFETERIRRDIQNAIEGANKGLTPDQARQLQQAIRSRRAPSR